MVTLNRSSGQAFTTWSGLAQIWVRSPGVVAIVVAATLVGPALARSLELGGLASPAAGSAAWRVDGLWLSALAGSIAVCVAADTLAPLWNQGGLRDRALVRWSASLAGPALAVGAGLLLTGGDAKDLVGETVALTLQFWAWTRIGLALDGGLASSVGSVVLIAWLSPLLLRIASFPAPIIAWFDSRATDGPASIAAAAVSLIAAAVISTLAESRS